MTHRGSGCCRRPPSDIVIGGRAPGEWRFELEDIPRHDSDPAVIDEPWGNSQDEQMGRLAGLSGWQAFCVSLYDAFENGQSDQVHYGLACLINGFPDTPNGTLEGPVLIPVEDSVLADERMVQRVEHLGISPAEILTCWRHPEYPHRSLLDTALYVGDYQSFAVMCDAGVCPLVKGIDKRFAWNAFVLRSQLDALDDRVWQRHKNFFVNADYYVLFNMLVTSRFTEMLDVQAAERYVSHQDLTYDPAWQPGTEHYALVMTMRTIFPPGLMRQRADLWRISYSQLILSLLEVVKDIADMDRRTAWLALEMSDGFTSYFRREALATCLQRGRLALAEIIRRPMLDTPRSMLDEVQYMYYKLDHDVDFYRLDRDRRNVMQVCIHNSDFPAIHWLLSVTPKRGEGKEREYFATSFFNSVTRTRERNTCMEDVFSKLAQVFTVRDGTPSQRLMRVAQWNEIASLFFLYSTFRRSKDLVPHYAKQWSSDRTGLSFLLMIEQAGVLAGPDCLEIVTHYDGYTPLHVCMAWTTMDHSRRIGSLLGAGFSRQAVDRRGFKPVHMGVEWRNAGALAALLSYNPSDINLRISGGQGLTPYDLASEMGWEDGKRILRQAMTQYNMRQTNPLVAAVLRCDAEDLRHQLTVQTAAIHELGGATPEARAAVVEEYQKLADRLQPAFTLAITSGCRALLPIFMDAAPRLRFMRPRPLSVAISHYQTRCCYDMLRTGLFDEFLEREYGPANMDGPGDDHPLVMAVQFGSHHLVRTIALYMHKRDMYLDIHGREGLTAMQLAVKHRDMVMVHILLRYGADLDIHTRDKYVVDGNGVLVRDDDRGIHITSLQMAQHDDARLFNPAHDQWNQPLFPLLDVLNARATPVDFDQLWPEWGDLGAPVPGAADQGESSSSGSTAAPMELGAGPAGGSTNKSNRRLYMEALGDRIAEYERQIEIKQDRIDKIAEELDGEGVAEHGVVRLLQKEIDQLELLKEKEERELSRLGDDIPDGDIEAAWREVDERDRATLGGRHGTYRPATDKLKAKPEPLPTPQDEPVDDLAGLMEAMNIEAQARADVARAEAQQEAARQEARLQQARRMTEIHVRTLRDTMSSIMTQIEMQNALIGTFQRLRFSMPDEADAGIARAREDIQQLQRDLTNTAIELQEMEVQLALMPPAARLGGRMVNYRRAIPPRGDGPDRRDALTPEESRDEWDDMMQEMGEAEPGVNQVSEFERRQLAANQLRQNIINYEEHIEDTEVRLANREQVIGPDIRIEDDALGAAYLNVQAVVRDRLALARQQLQALLERYPELNEPAPARAGAGLVNTQVDALGVAGLNLNV